MTGERPPYLTRACAACKEKKLRCLMNESPPWTCKRCAQKKLECFIPEVRPRQRRKKVHELRILRLEENVDRVISMLPSSRRAASESTPNTEGAPPDGVPAVPAVALGSSPAGAVPGSAGSNAGTTGTTGSAGTTDIPGIESLAQANQLLADYHQYFAQNFPYVVVPADATVFSLREACPMTLLAVLVTASWKDGRRLDALNQHFLEQLSTKLIVHSDRDLDLLYGLLLYLRWIHLHMGLKKQQAYRLMSIATSMAVDYGITRRPGKGRHQQLNVEVIKEVPRGLAVINADYWSVEAQRAYLACYQMATWFSIITRKMSPLPYSDYLVTCAQSLAAAKTVPSDAELIFHLEITREADKIYTLFNYTETRQPQYMNDEQIQIYISAFSAKLQDWKTRLPLSLAEDACYMGVPWLFESFMREVSLSGMSPSDDMSVFRIRVLMASLESTKKFFDSFLAIPPPRIMALPSTHWALLEYAVQLAAAMSLSMQTPGWNIDMARTIVKLDTYIDAMSVHVRYLSAMMVTPETIKDWYGSLLLRWDAIRSSYLATLHQNQAAAHGPVAVSDTTGTSLPTSLPNQHAAAAAPIPPYDYRGNTAQHRPEADAFFPTAGSGLPLLDFAANGNSWIVPDFDFPWNGVTDF